MNLFQRSMTAPSWVRRLRAVLNLNDPRWGRGDNEGDGKPQPSRSQGPRQGPPDLEELWRDWNRKINQFLGGGKPPSEPGSGGDGSPPPSARSAGVGAAVIVGVLLLIWLGTGFFIVQEGQKAVITQFGSYKSTVGAGFNWRWPYPIQRHELVFVTQIRSVDVGRDSIVKATGLRESAMLTEDENIVEIKFAVQYRLSDARAFLFESKKPDEAVVYAAETAVREVVGKMRMDSALAEERDQIGPRVRALMQTILDRYKVGIEVVSINLQQGGVRPPEQVQAAFDDVLKAGQERERTKNEAQAYANDVIPRAVGSASRAHEDAQAYKARVVAQAQGDAQRFKALLVEVQKSPQVARDRMTIDALREIYGNVTKIVATRGQNLVFQMPERPLNPGVTVTTTTPAPTEGVGVGAVGGSGTPPPSADVRTRDGSRTRDRDGR